MVDLSVAIVTKARVIDLSQCLGSLLSNDILPKEIIVIDNNSNDSTKQLVQGLSANAKVDVRYVLTKSVGYPKIYNKGLNEAKGDWIAFIDDDCVASINWTREILSTINKYPEHAAIMGWCETYNQKNVYSQSSIMFDNDWKQRSIIGNKVIDLEVLDTKNIVFNNKFLKSHNLKFDNSRSDLFLGAAQDCDFGMQIQSVGGKAVCNKRIAVMHKDPLYWFEFIKKNYLSWESYNSLNLKWNIIRRKNLKLKSVPLNKLVGDVAKKWRLNWFQKIKLLIISRQVLLFNRIFYLIFFVQYKMNKLKTIATKY